MRFWDSSALVTLIIEQEKSKELREFLNKNSEILAWWGSEAECFGALCRLQREGCLSKKAFSVAQKMLSEFATSWHIVQPVHEVMVETKKILRRHVLKTADAFQLAAAVCGAEGEPGSLEFVCLDRRLGEVAEREGFIVLP